MSSITSSLSRVQPATFILIAHVWNVLLAIICVATSVQIWNLSDFGNLGRPVQVFASIVTLIPVAIAAYVSLGLIAYTDQKQRSRYITGAQTRYAAMVFYYVGMVLCGMALIETWNVFDGFEFVVSGFMANAWLGYAFAGAYALSWLSGRKAFEEKSIATVLQRASLLVGLGALALLLVFSGFLDGMVSILSSYSNPNVIGLTVGMLVFAFLATKFLFSGAYFGELPEQRTSWQGWLLLSPNIIGFMFFFAGPLLLSLYLSFTNSTVGRTPEFIGLQNYIDIMTLEIQTQTNLAESPQRALSFGFNVLASIDLSGTRYILGAKDPLFWQSLRNTILFCLLLVPMGVIPALGLSIVLNSSLPGVKFFRAVYFLPSVAAVVGTALIWRWLYDPVVGFYNYIISGGVNVLKSLGLQVQDPQIQWLTDPNVVLFAMVFLAAWQILGYNTVLFLAGLQGIPKQLYEAAQIDGANPWQQFRNVTIPMLSPTTFFVLITTVVTGLQVFNEPYSLFTARPIPVNATTSVFYLYNAGFFQFRFGYASAIAWLLFIIIFSITFLQFRFNRSNAYE